MFFPQQKGGLLTKQLTEILSLPGRYQGKENSRCSDRVEELLRQLPEFLSVTLSHTHTHTALPLSFLASDSRHPAMTWGVSLAASKAALNRQKYLLWQTDRPSPTMTCMQLSLSLPLFFPTLWFDFPVCNSLWTVFPSFFSFLQQIYTILNIYIVLVSVWHMAREEVVEEGGGSAFMRPALACTGLALCSFHSLMLLFLLSFAFTQESILPLSVCSALSLSQSQPFSIRRVRKQSEE